MSYTYILRKDRYFAIKCQNQTFKNKQKIIIAFTSQTTTTTVTYISKYRCLVSFIMFAFMKDI